MSQGVRLHIEAQPIDSSYSASYVAEKPETSTW